MKSEELTKNPESACTRGVVAHLLKRIEKLEEEAKKDAKPTKKPTKKSG